MSRSLIIIGLILVLLGLLWPLLAKLGVGRLPGDISLEKDNVRFYFPLTTSIIVSILASVCFWFFRK